MDMAVDEPGHGAIFVHWQRVPRFKCEDNVTRAS
jgi:hypothetical protein